MTDFTHKIVHFTALPVGLTGPPDHIPDTRVAFVAVRDDGAIFVLNRFAGHTMDLTLRGWYPLDPIPGTPPRKAFLEREIEKAITHIKGWENTTEAWIAEGKTPPETIAKGIAEDEERIKSLRAELGEEGDATP